MFRVDNSNYAIKAKPKKNTLKTNFQGASIYILE